MKPFLFLADKVCRNLPNKFKVSASGIKERSSKALRANPKKSGLLFIGLFGYGSYTAYSGAKSFFAPNDDNSTPKKRIVVLGTGWAGTSFLKDIDSSQYDVQVISPRNYFAFTPLLPSVTVGTVEARSIVEPVRNILKKKRGNTGFLEAECYKIDAKNKKVHCRPTKPANPANKEEFIVDYDYLVVAMGARPNTFNIPGVEEHTHFLKEIDDAQNIRKNVIDCFEKASLPDQSEEERKKNLHFVVVGGGPTGVEFAAELHDFIEEDLCKLYPKVKDFVKITLLEGAGHILSMFDKRITAFAEEKFKRDGIDVKLGSMVVKVGDKEITTKVKIDGADVYSAIPYGMVVWSGGIGKRPVISSFMNEIGQDTRRPAVATDEWLRVEGCDSIYALGDCATIDQRKVMDDIEALFTKVDKDKKGTLTVKELQNVVDDICERYPQIKQYMQNKKMKKFDALLEESKGDKAKESERVDKVDVQGFKAALSAVDSEVKRLPPTAQVANQQGQYLAKCFNRMKECEQNPEGPLRVRDMGRHRFRPFRYRHLGQFAPLGGEQTAAQLPGDWVSIGHSSQWLWYSVYASKQVSWRNRLLVITDWARRFVHGRDSSRI
ncbi:NADH:ubiquinone reductase (non-electrogenic) [Ranunculus cassubicifolius]